MAYSSPENVESLLKRELTADEQGILSLVFDAVDKYINERVGGSFGTASPSTRYFDGMGNNILDIDPCYDITAVSIVDSSEDVTSDFELDPTVLRPVNETIKQWIELRNRRFPKGSANIAVTAKFSLGETPSDIEYLATYLVTKFFNEYITGNIESESIEGYSRKFGTMEKDDFIVKTILDKYTSDNMFF